MYFNAHHSNVVGTAGFISPPIYANMGRFSPFCMSFAYFVKGRFSAFPISIYILRGGKRKSEIWKGSYWQTFNWKVETVQLNVMNQDQVYKHIIFFS